MTSRKSLTFGSIPEWHADAKCSRPGTDPRDYDLASTGAKRAAEMIRAAYACLDCPVVHECARQAVTEKATGVIRGGLCCPAETWKSRGSVNQSALEAVARGDDPRAVAAYTAARHDSTAAAVVPLAALATEYAPPLDWTPPAPVRAPRG